jgi:adenosylcobyric acid synthase
VLGTTWHGIFESDGFRGALLRRVAAAAGRSFEPGDITFAGLRERKLDSLADLIDAHMDTAALQDLINHGAPAGLPFIPPGTP